MSKTRAGKMIESWWIFFLLPSEVQ